MLDHVGDMALPRTVVPQLGRLPVCGHGQTGSVWELYGDLLLEICEEWDIPPGGRSGHLTRKPVYYMAQVSA